MNKTEFTVDSGDILIIDPRFLQRFAEHFSYQEFVTRSGPGHDPQTYINEVANKAFPLASGQLIGYMHSDGIFGDTDFVGDGHYELSSKNIKMTPQYRRVFKQFINREEEKASRRETLHSRRSSRDVLK